MEIFRFSTRLRLDHPTLDPGLISAALGMIPFRQWKAGDLRRNPVGKELGGVYDYTYWCSQSRRGEDSELIDVMESDLNELEKKAAFLADFCSTGGSILYYISWFASERSGGDTIHYRLLERFAALQISLSLDVYSAEQPDDIRAVQTGERPGTLPE